MVVVVASPAARTTARRRCIAGHRFPGPASMAPAVSTAAASARSLPVFQSRPRIEDDDPIGGSNEATAAQLVEGGPGGAAFRADVEAGARGERRRGPA